jgi:hypothetical protein
MSDEIPPTVLSKEKSCFDESMSRQTSSFFFDTSMPTKTEESEKDEEGALFME